MLVDQYGNPLIRQSYNRSTENRGVDRPWIPTKLDNIDKLIPSYDRNTLVAVSRMLVENWGPARSIARQIPMYSVGKAWKPSLETSDDAIKLEAESVIREQFCRMATMKGDDLSTVLYHMAHLLIRDGECFYLLTEWQSGFPAIQIIPAHRIGQRENAINPIEEGAYRGYTINEGVIRNKYGVVIAYRLLGETADKDQDISSSSLKHVMDSDYPEANRGYPALSHALNDGRDALQAHEWERLNMLARSSHTLIEHSESGIPDGDRTNEFFNEAGGDSSSPSNLGITTNTLFGGTYKTVRAGTGYKLESVKHDTPGETWESFGDRMIRKMCAGVPWPFSFIWEGSSRGGGTAERRDIMQARQAVEDMQSIIEKEARLIVGYAYKKLVKLGRVSDTADWWKWSFSKPPKLTVDDGRVTKSNLELWRAGILNDEDLLNDMGKDHDEHFRSRFNRAADKELMFIEAQQSKNVKLDERYKGMFTPNDMKDVDSPMDDDTTQQEDNLDDEN